jgi:C-terminal processing protease CtpA/Prc
MPSLDDVLNAAGSLTAEDRLTIVNQAIVLLDGFYAHLPLKRAMHAVDPLQRLRLLRKNLEQIGSERRFHAEMTSIFTSLRDLHTNYFLPAPFSRIEVTLPFLVEDYVEAGAWRYLVTSTRGPMPHPAFARGVEITHWNGVPINRAVANAADHHAGSNPAARRRNGLAGLTTRPLFVVPPPDEAWVVVTFAEADGTRHEATFEWEVFGLPEQAPAAGGVADAQSARQGIDRQTVAVQRARRRLFVPESADAAGAAADDAAAQGLRSRMPHNFRARIVDASQGRFGHIRIWSFADEDDPRRADFVTDFVREFRRLLERMPGEGLIIDVRDNGGGYINAGERILQMLTPVTIEPERLQFINTPLTKMLVDANDGASWLNLSPWVRSIGRAVETGATYSSSFPLTEPESCNDIGQVYHGPVVVITNARCYSTTDIFAAGFQDHDIGKVLGVDNNTGAGGANVWDHELLDDAFGQDPASPIQPLPLGVGMRVAIRRTLRVGAEAGTELEDLGVKPFREHLLTRRDLLEDNIDLLEDAAALLDPERRFVFRATTRRQGGALVLKVTSARIDRLDIEIDGRPQGSHDIGDGESTIALGNRAGPGELWLRGYRQGQLAAARRLSF